MDKIFTKNQIIDKNFQANILEKDLIKYKSIEGEGDSFKDQIIRILRDSNDELKKGNKSIGLKYGKCFTYIYYIYNIMSIKIREYSDNPVYTLLFL